MKVIQSTVEQSAWLLVVILIVVMGAVVYLQIRQSQEIRSAVMQINQKMDCISNYFNQPNRADLTINSLSSCHIQRQ